MNLEKRLEDIMNTDANMRSLVERHLREACDEAMAETMHTCKCSCDSTVVLRSAPIPQQPTAADALKAVAELTEMLLRVGVFSRYHRINDDAVLLKQGCLDMRAGHRDTPAARAIIGEDGK